MVLNRVFSPDCIIIDLESTEKDELFEEMVQTVISANPQINREEAVNGLLKREAQMSTGIMHRIAVPHAVCESVHGCIGAIGISRNGIEYESLDGAPVNLVFMFLFGTDDDMLHLDVLKEIALLLQNPMFAEEIVNMKTPEDVYRKICTALN